MKKFDESVEPNFMVPYKAIHAMTIMRGVPCRVLKNYLMASSASLRGCLSIYRE